MTQNANAAARQDGGKKTLFGSLSAYLRARSLVMLLLGFSAGLPSTPPADVCSRIR